MSVGRLATAGIVAASLLAGCSSTGERASPSSSEQPKPVPMLDGTYRVEIDGQKTLRDGGPSPEQSTSLQWAFRSGCAGRDEHQRDEGCIAVAVPVNDAAPPQTGAPSVWDYVDGAWVRTVDGGLKCRDVPTPTLETWSLTPGDGGTFTGTRHLAFFGTGCGSVIEQFVTGTRSGDVDPAVVIPDPASQPPLKPSAGAGLWGRYNKIQVQQGQPPIPVIELGVTTNCVRNTENCLTYTVYEPPDKPRRVSGYRLLDGRWASAVPYDVTCADGSPVRITVETEWPLPLHPPNPIPRIAGVQRDVYAQPCVKAVESQLVLERIGD
jgi:serine/threonine-protein kinase